MIHNVKILFFICFFTACSSTEQKEIVTAGELLRQAAFYGERLQFLPALETYQQAIKLAEKEKDSTVFSLAYLEMGKIYRYQSLKQKALQSEKKALSYIKSPACDSLRLELYREIWEGEQLVGGLYGVTLGRCFFGESMFSLVPSASKLALIHLAQFFGEHGGVLIDCQFETPHLKSMGGRYISYEEYMELLQS
jgi:tetratricopeptide (TPR) repeat protein